MAPALAGVLVILGSALWVYRQPAPSVRAPHPFFGDEGVLVWAHRGASAEAPGNSMLAFERALKLGADVLETDLRLAADGVVLSHDAGVETVTAATGPVRARSLAELAALNLAEGFVDWRGVAWAGAPVGFASLEQFLVRFGPDLRSGRVKASLELKEDDPELARLTWEAVQAHGVASAVVVSSFSGAALAAFRVRAGGVVATLAPPADVLGLRVCEAWGARARCDTPADGLALFPVVGPLHFDDPALMDGLRARGLPVTFMTINDEAEMRRLFALGARGIITDRPDLALRVLGRAAPG